jgi:hypothetical protein
VFVLQSCDEKSAFTNILSSLWQNFSISLYDTDFSTERGNMVSTGRKHVSHIQLQSLLGPLNFPYKVLQANLRRICDRVPSNFRSYWVGYMWKECLPVRTSAWASFQHILISLTSYTIVCNWMRILYSSGLGIKVIFCTQKMLKFTNTILLRVMFPWIYK